MILSNFTESLSFIQCDQPLSRVGRASITRLGCESGHPYNVHVHVAFASHIAKTLQIAVLIVL